MVDNRVLRQNKNMNNENDLEKVYVVGQMSGDQASDCSEGSDSDQDQRRRTLPFSDEASNSTDLRGVMDPFNSESGVTLTEESTVTPASNKVPSRSGNSNTGTISYNDINSRTKKQPGNIPAAKKTTNIYKPSDIFLSVSTAFLNTVPAISLEDIKFKGSQQLLQFTKLPENLQLPKDPQMVIEYKGWRTTAETFLNAYGSTLAIFKARKWSWDIKMTPTILAAHLQRTGTPHDAILTSSQMHLFHSRCVFENLDLSSRNFNIWQSVVFLYTFLVKAAEFVPVLFQIIEQIEINDVIAVMAAIDEFYIVLPDPELYARGLAVATIQVGVHWTIRHVQGIIAVAAKESALIGQVVSEELKKFIYYRATQAIFKKYHSDLDPKLRD